MQKRFTIILSVLLACAGASASTAGNNSTECSLPHPVVNTRAIRALPGARIAPELKFPKLAAEKQAEVSAFPLSILTPAQILKAGGSASHEKLDEVTRELLDGEPVTRQIFTYTEKGQPLHADNYARPDYDEWAIVSTFDYKYDELGRIVRSDNTGFLPGYTTERYEYTYSDNSAYYSRIIYYRANPDTDKLEAVQRADYKYDEYGNTVSQELFTSDDNGATWLFMDKKEASFLENGLQTSYFVYTPNDTQDAWVGDTGERYEYRTDGLDDKISRYIWENDAWLEYERDSFTYSDKGLLQRQDNVYWNRDAQDWSGNDTYGFYTLRNSYTEYSYDSDGNILSSLFYQKNNAGEYVVIQKELYANTALDNGGLEITHETHLRWQGSEPTLCRKEIIRRNRFGSEYYYKHFTYTSGREMATQEEVREIDANNVYHSGNFYSFTNDENNSRYGEQREEFFFDATTPTAFKPVSGKHYFGTGRDTDTSWKEDSNTEFIWNPALEDAYVGFNYYKVTDGERTPVSAFLNEYDFEADMANIWMWPISGKRPEFYTNKTLRQCNWFNYDGDSEWDTSNSYVDTFHYSSTEEDGIDNRIADPEAKEISRYDLLGNRLTAPRNGINIVRYSDGTVRKVMVVM